MGVLANGDLLDNWYYGRQNGTLILEPIPEPATLLLLGLGAVMVRRKRVRR